MDLQQLLTLMLSLFILAIVPGPVVFAVISRSFSNGLLAALQLIIGVTLADYLFICIALFGLTALAGIMGPAFIVIQYASAAYLSWLGISLLRTKAPQSNEQEIQTENQHIQEDEQKLAGFSLTRSIPQSLKNCLVGLMIGLSNPKAIIFYVGFFPAFIPATTITILDALSVMLVATIAFGSINFLYALLAIKARTIFNSPKATLYINRFSGSIMLTAGILIAINL
ncbi:LysE family translocator [Shewanella donghaensis]|uniref:LysE family translocator n=1 Tax=Shewanella donghaensis TaxID=238836 RepID=UPI0011820003|nr:LysE family translocator [Shewanella donghaensis]